MNIDTSLVKGLWPDVSGLFPELALREIESMASNADREGSFSSEGMQVLRKIGWLGLAVPTKFGGLGATVVEACAVQRKLGGADPGLAIAGSMHLGSVGVWVQHYQRQPDMTWVFMEAVAKQKLIVASAVAEASLGGSVNRSNLLAKRVEGGWEVSGSKSPLSFASHADLISLQMQSEASDGKESEVLVALVPRTLPGISSKLTWDTMGMRGSGSDTLILDRCVIPDPLVIYHGVPGVAADDDIVSGICYFSLILTATYLGLAEASLLATRKLLLALKIQHLGAVRAELPTYQGAIGVQIAALLTLEAAAAGLAMQMDRGISPQLLIGPALALKQNAIRLIPEIVSGFADTCGGASYSRKGWLERFWRDSQAIRFHPPTSAAVLQYLGRAGLGLPAALDLDEAAPGLRASQNKTQH